MFTQGSHIWRAAWFTVAALSLAERGRAPGMRLTQRIYPLSFDAASISVWDSDLVMPMETAHIPEYTHNPGGLG